MNGYPDEVELQLERMAQGGDCVGRWQERVIFAAGGLPGERVRVRLHERKARYARGSVVAVLSPSPQRIAPRLPAADHMPWQYIDYAAQVQFKQAILAEQLAKLAGVANAPVAPMLAAAQPWGYRNTAYLRVQPASGRTGYYAAGSHTLNDMDADPLLLPALNEALAGLRPLLAEQEYPHIEAVTLRGSAAYGYGIALLHGSGSLDALAARWRAQVPTLAAVATAAAPDITFYEELGDVVFSLSPRSFFQTNTAQAAVLLDTVRSMLDLQPHERLLDAYSGAGAFALPLSCSVREVLAIEQQQQAVTDGQRTARLNAIDNVLFLHAAVEQVDSQSLTPIHAAILDPPRRGCHPATLATLARLAPARIVYISCHPGTLARDVQLLLASGYLLRRVQPIDLFPQTPHIECAALLTRATASQ